MPPHPPAALRRFIEEVGSVDAVGVEERVAKFTTRSLKKKSKVFGLKLAASMIDLTTLEGKDTPGFSSADLATGAVTIVNVWASWCLPCRSEHPLLLSLAQRSDARLFGINQKDEPENARRFLGSLGNPFKAVGADTGRVSIDWGVYGVPETFIVDGKGIIRLKWIGPLSAEGIRTVIEPKIAELNKSQP